MNNGSIKKIDELGRIVIPKDIRKRLSIKKDDSLEGLFTAIKLLLGAKAEKDIRAMKLTVNGLKTVIIAIMAQVNEVSYEEMEKRFQNK